MRTSRREVLRGLAAGAALATIGGRAVAATNEGPLVRLQYFSLDGKPLGVVSGNFRYPAGVRIRDNDLVVPDLLGRVTHDGNLYVVEWVPDGRVSKWRRVGA